MSNLLEADLVSFLGGIEAITELAADRIFGLIREPSSQLPALMIQRTSTTRLNTFCGPVKLTTGAFQLDSYAMTGQDAWGLAAAVKTALENFRGMMGATTINQVYLVNEFPSVDPDPGVIRVTQLFDIWYYQE